MIFTIFRAYPSYPLLVAMYPISWVLSNAAILVAYLIILSKMKKKMYEGGTA